MNKKTIQVDKYQKELCTHGTSEFPMTVHHDKLWTFEGNSIPCHWHDDLELVLVQQGHIRYQIYDKSHILTPGQGLLINSAIPHSAIPVLGGHVSLLTVIIQPVFLYDWLGSSIELNYFRPFLHSRKYSCMLLTPENNWMKTLLTQLEAIDHYFTEKPFGYELKIKSLLCDFFFNLFAQNHEFSQGVTLSNQEDLRRLSILLDYLHLHYNRNISLQELADKVHITREACCRFFKHMTGQTISQYLTEYRVSKSFSLLEDGCFSVTQISNLCGFSNPSRFSAAFRNRMGQTPREYLKNRSTLRLSKKVSEKY